MKIKHSFTVTEDTTLLGFLRDCFPAKSRNYAKGILGRGQVRVEGLTQTHFAFPLTAGQQVEILDEAEEKSAAVDIPLVYEDDELLVIDKPAGILSIATDREREKTAYYMATEHVRRKDGESRVFIVHRLDRETSGLMLFAKTAAMKTALQEGWDSLVTRRGYAAVVEGVPEKREDRLVSWLKQTRTLMVYSSGREGDGKKAVTSYKTLQENGSYALLGIELETGRKNQIRVQLSELGHPVAGDRKYGARENPLGRLCLHACALFITRPDTGEALRFESKIPASFLSLSGKQSGKGEVL